MARVLGYTVSALLWVACGSAPSAEETTPEAVPVAAVTVVEPGGGGGGGGETADPAEATTDPSEWTVAWKVRLERADGTQEHWDLDQEAFAANAGSWVCRLGRVSASRSVAIVNGRVRSQGSELREIDCTRGDKREHGSAHCGWAVGLGGGGDEVPPIDEVELALEEGGDVHRLTLRCEVDTSGA